MSMGDKSKIEYHGQIAQTPHEQPGRQDEWAENRVATAIFIGKYDDVCDKMNSLRPGLSMSNFNGWSDKTFNAAYYIRTMSVTREDGDTGVLTVTFVKCPRGPEQPYNKVWEVGMEEVQKKLITHPYIQDSADVDILFKWEETPKQFRFDGTYYWYSTGEMIGDYPQLVKITGEAEIKYCKAIMAGIETFNLYMPVVCCTSYYVKVPGVLYDSDGIVQGGTIHTDDKVGHFDTPDVTARGFFGGNWLKSMDKFIEAADGTCTRNEQWTYTPDTEHTWIYEDID